MPMPIHWSNVDRAKVESERRTHREEGVARENNQSRFYSVAASAADLLWIERTRSWSTWPQEERSPTFSSETEKS